VRTIDADALKELFSEVIGHIAKKPEMNGNLEHMIRASAMVIQMIDDAPTVQPDTTTHDSIPAETGKNDGDGTSGDCISKTGHWILDRSGAYCCSKCMEPCATYAMMKPRDKFCKMCGSRNEVAEWCQ
jgi:hypothetical protein